MNYYKKNQEYVIHEHFADRAGHHYDLRIMIPNKQTLASWALPKAKIPEPGEKVLAIRGANHDKKWLDFKGKIEDGYGKGTIKILERGKLDFIGFSEVYMTFEARGKILNGTYVLLRMKQRQNRKNNEWMLIHKKIIKEVIDNTYVTESAVKTYLREFHRQ